jgi:hypothetical protein
MAFASTTSAADPVPADAGINQQYDAPDLRAYMFGLFFVFGGITSLRAIAPAAVPSKYFLSARR